eukprot:scaffold23888_cov45-Phaeocystis_antarctica.AAC.1
MLTPKDGGTMQARTEGAWACGGWACGGHVRTMHTPCTYSIRPTHTPCTHHARTMHTPCTHHAGAHRGHGVGGRGAAGPLHLPADQRARVGRRVPSGDGGEM